MTADPRPFWKKLTNVGIALVTVAGAVLPFVPEPYTKIALAVIAAGAALGLKGAARRADRVRRDAIADANRAERIRRYR